MQKGRSQELELLDLGPSHYSSKEYADCLHKLNRIGKWLGGDLASFSALSKMSPQPQTILDVGCGGGFFTLKLAEKVPDAKILGIDLNSDAIQFALQQQLLKPHLRNVTFETRSQEELSEPQKSADLVISTLVCHHLPDQKLIDFISKACQIAKRKVIFNDLHRHPLALFLFKIIAPICFRNRLVLHDGPLSIKRSFTRADWISCLEKAGLKPSQYTIRWRWAFRWIIEIDCKDF